MAWVGSCPQRPPSCWPVTDHTSIDRNADPTTAPFWEAVRRFELVIQHCRICQTHQFYPRSVCLTCFGVDLEWVPASGLGVVYSQTTVRVNVVPEWIPPYVVGVVILDEGVRMTAHLVGKASQIGDRVRVAWRQRPGKSPLPVFEPLEISPSAVSTE